MSAFLTRILIDFWNLQHHFYLLHNFHFLCQCIIRIRKNILLCYMLRLTLLESDANLLLGIESNLNVHKTFRRGPEHPLKVLHTFRLRFVFRGLLHATSLISILWKWLFLNPENMKVVNNI